MIVIIDYAVTTLAFFRRMLITINYKDRSFPDQTVLNVGELNFQHFQGFTLPLYVRSRIGEALIF